MNVKVKETLKIKIGRAASMRPPNLKNSPLKASAQAGSSTPPHLKSELGKINAARRDVRPYRSVRT